MKHLYVCGCTMDGGIYHYTLEGDTLSLQQKLSLDRPMYMVIEGGKAYIILREIESAAKHGGLIICDIQESGHLVPRGEPQSTHGIVPCHVAVRDADVYIPNYLSGNIVKMPDVIRTHIGHGPHARRQESAHTHFCMVTPDSHEVLCVDLGRDVIAVYDRELNLQYEVSMPAGCGPRHLALTEDGGRLVCVNELACSLSLLKKQEKQWKCVQTIPLLSNFTHEDTAAAIRIQGDHIYTSIRGANLIVSVLLDENGLHKMEETNCGGVSPRDIWLDADHLFSANELSGTLSVMPVAAGHIGPAETIAYVPGGLCVCTIDL